MPYMEVKDKYDFWCQNIYTPTAFDQYSNQAAGLISTFVCPSARVTPDNLSYGANTGLNSQASGKSILDQGTAPIAVLPPFLSNRAEEGVFLDQYVNPLVNPPVKGVPAKVSIDYVSTHDGTSCTIMLGENNNNAYRAANNIHVFWNHIEGASPFSDTTSIAQTAENWGINWKGLTPLPPGNSQNEKNQFSTTDKLSACHSGGIVIVSYCDASQQNFRTDVDATIFARLLMPFDRGKYAKDMNTPPALFDTSATGGTDALAPLDESAFR
jgi:hypothetical protein